MTTGSGLQINVVYEANVTSAPAGFKAAVQAAVDFFSTTFSALSTSLTIQVGWGTVNGHTIAAGSTAASSSPLWDVSYQSLRTLLARADASSPDVAAITAGLATIDPTAGAGQFVVTQAQAKALGFNLSNPGAIDGYVGLSSSTNFNYTGTAGSGYDAVGAIEHEITEILGRLVFANGTTSSNSSKALYSLLDLFRYTGTGAHTYQPGASYFSIDDGVHNLKDFNNGAINTGDDGDWATTSTSDAFDAFGRPGVLYNISTVDLRVMELLGYHLTPAAAAKLPPSVGPGIGGTAQSAPAGGTLTGTSADDWLQGMSGNTTLHGGGGSDYLVGAPPPFGMTTATYDGVYRQYTVTTSSLGTVTGGTVGGGPEGGMDTLQNIQRIQFVDGYLATGTTDTAGQVYRVYEATLGRAPDVVGLANWVHSLNGGTSLQTVVNGFTGSNEFQALYGNVDNTGFITLLYNNVLHRAPDTSGLNNWLSYLASGHSRAEVVTGFSESPEDINTLAAPVQQGLWVGDAAAGQVARLYDAVLGRMPDAAGLGSWTHLLEGGTDTLQQVANGFTGSAEFQAAYGNLNDTQFIGLLYQNVLHRSADTSGLSNWLSYLASGHTRADVVLGFSESPEHIGNLAPHIDSGVWVTG